MDVCADVRTEIVFCQDFEGLTQVFDPRCAPGYALGRPRDTMPLEIIT